MRISASLALVVCSLFVQPTLAQSCVTVVPDGVIGLGLANPSTDQPFVPSFATMWDQDGSGPQRAKLLVERGRFGFTPDQPAPGSVPSNDILMTDGTTFEFIPRPPGNRIAALGTYENQLLALTSSIGTSAAELFRRDATTWTRLTLPPGVDQVSASSGFIETPNGIALVNAGTVLVFDPASGSVSYSGVTGIPSNNGLSFVKIHDDIYGIGVMQINGVPVGIVKLVNGEWLPQGQFSSLRATRVTGLVEHEGRLIALGQFQTAENAPRIGLFELTATGWIEYAPSVPVTLGTPNALASTSRGLLVAQSGRTLRIVNETQNAISPLMLTRSATTASLRIVGTWDNHAILITSGATERGPTGAFGTTDQLGAALMSGVVLSDGSSAGNITPVLNGLITDFVNYAGDTYALGGFASSSSERMRFVARRENGRWRGISEQGGPQQGIVDGAEWDGKLAVAWFDSTSRTSRISTWDGTAWTATIDGPPFRRIVSIEATPTHLYCVTDRGVTVQRTVYRLDGDTWVPIGEVAISGQLVRAGTELYIDAFRVTPDRLELQVADDTATRIRVIGAIGERAIGTTAGGGSIVAAPGTYELIDGVWRKHGSAVTLYPRTAAWQHELFLALPTGDSISSGVSISRWNGATWAPVTSSNGRLLPNFAAFNQFVTVDTAMIHDLDADMPRFAAAAIGMFGGTTDITATLDLKPRVSFSRVPQAIRVQPSQTFTLRAQVISQGQFTYQWTRDNAALVDGPLPTGEVITGATGPTLSITNSTAALNGSYTLTVTPVDASLFCGPESTFPVPVTVERFCDSIDFNNNFVFPEEQDIIDFLSVFAGGACSTAVCNDIDFNNNDIFPEDQDVIDFFNVLSGSSCP